MQTSQVKRANEAKKQRDRVFLKLAAELAEEQLDVDEVKKLQATGRVDEWQDEAVSNDAGFNFLPESHR